jgi:hypothetical protein
MAAEQFAGGLLAFQGASAVPVRGDDLFIL